MSRLISSCLAARVSSTSSCLIAGGSCSINSYSMSSCLMGSNLTAPERGTEGSITDGDNRVKIVEQVSDSSSLTARFCEGLIVAAGPVGGEIFFPS